MPRVTMPDGQLVDMPDKPTAGQLAALEKIQSKNSWDRRQAGAPQGSDILDFVGGNVGKAEASLLGAPVDTALNVWDLGKAGIGAAQGAITGKPPSEMFDPTDRSGMVGSGQYIENLMRKGGVVRPGADPTTAGGQIAAGGIQGLTAGLLGGGGMSPGQAVGQGARGALGGALAGGAGAVGTDPATQQLAGLLPGAAHQSARSVADAARRGLVGNENVKANVEALKRGGDANPSPGVAANSKALQRTEAMLGRAPGGTGTIERAAEARTQGVGERLGTVQRALNPDGTSRTTAGGAIQGGAARKFEEIHQNIEQAWAPVDRLIPRQTPIRVSNSRAALRELAQPIRGAEATSNALTNPEIRSLHEGFEQDLAGTPEPETIVTPSKIMGPDGKPAFSTSAPAEPEEPGKVVRTQMWRQGQEFRTLVKEFENTLEGPREEKNHLPYEAVAALRTKVGKMIGQPGMMADPKYPAMEKLYAALSKDIETANVPPAARQALDRATRYTRAGYDRVRNVLKPLDDKKTPEAAYQYVMEGTRHGATRLRSVMGSLTPAQRNEVAAQVLEELNTPSPGSVGEHSIDQMATKWNKIHEDAKKVLFPDPKVRGQLDDIFDAVAKIKAGGRELYNPSGTVKGLAYYSILTTLSTSATAAMTGHPGVAAATAAGGFGGMYAVNRAARLLTNPEFTRWLAEGTKSSSVDVPRYLSRLVVIARNTKDPEQKQSIEELYDSLNQQLGLSGVPGGSESTGSGGGFDPSQLSGR